MKIVIDSAIPFINGLFEPYFEVLYCPGEGFSPEVVHDADALIIRTRTRCNRALLEGSRVKHIATATIGYDHIDLNYCREQGIKVTTSAGCNARGVLHWMGAALVHISESEGWLPQERVLGVVGVGNVGSLIASHAAAWGFRVICCDPPRAEAEGIEEFVAIDELIQKADIITLHTPLNESSHHLINFDRVAAMRPNAVIINTSRGEVVDERAILASDHKYLFDVWEHEPRIDLDLLAGAEIATTHIAGYTQQGKGAASRMVVAAISESFDLPLGGWLPPVAHPERRTLKWEELRETIHRHVDLAAESEQLRRSPWLFEPLRNEYQYREEYF